MKLLALVNEMQQNRFILFIELVKLLFTFKMYCQPLFAATFGNSNPSLLGKSIFADERFGPIQNHILDTGDSADIT